MSTLSISLPPSLTALHHAERDGSGVVVKHKFQIVRPGSDQNLHTRVDGDIDLAALARDYLDPIRDGGRVLELDDCSRAYRMQLSVHGDSCGE